MDSFDRAKYEQLLAHLFVRFPSVQQRGFASDAYKPGLEGMRCFDEILHHPWKQYRCIHVAGTNGKGSVCSMLSSALSAQGFKVGLYTSPHLLDFRERIKVAGELIPREAVWEFLHSFPLGDLSFFEITTGMAFWWFARQDVDYAVIETGLGGRLDSTNIITPVLSIITSIGLDHCALLGDTIEKIAAEKAGIFKKDVPALVGQTDPRSYPVFEQTALNVGAPLFYAKPTDHLNTDLKSPCQQLNVDMVRAALSILGIKAEDAAIANAARNTGLRGRWESLRTNPCIIADIGHNPAALQINFKELSSRKEQVTIVYGIMADKDLDSIIPLFPANARLILCAPDIPRALPVPELFLKVRESRPDCIKAQSVAAAVELALKNCNENDTIYIGGSTFVVSEAITYLESL